MNVAMPCKSISLRLKISPFTAVFHKWSAASGHTQVVGDNREYARQLILVTLYAACLLENGDLF